MSDFLSHSMILLIAALAAGYILGALPMAAQISRLYGVDIFNTGTGLAGAANVWQNVGKVPAGAVMVGDMIKGILSVSLGGLLGFEGVWVLAPAYAALYGHWRSAFSGFRGGDGLALLGGITIAVFPVYGVIGVAVGGVVSLGGKVFPYTSLLSIVFGFLTIVSLGLVYHGDPVVILGLGMMACVVLCHAVLGHSRRNSGGVGDG